MDQEPGEGAGRFYCAVAGKSGNGIFAASTEQIGLTKKNGTEAIDALA